MALKTWIDEIKTAASGECSEAILEPERAPKDNGLSPGKEDHPEYTENHVHAIIAPAVREIERNQNGIQYRLTYEIKACEDEVNHQAKAILYGTSLDFEALREACSRWVESSGKATTPSTPGKLF